MGYGSCADSLIPTCVDSRISNPCYIACVDSLIPNPWTRSFVISHLFDIEEPQVLEDSKALGK